MLAHVKMHLGNSSNPSVSNSEPPSLSQRGDPFASSSSVNLDTELGLRERPLVGDVPGGKKNLDPTVGRRTTAGPSALEKEKKAKEKNDATECELLDTKKSDNEKKDDSTMDELGLAVDIEVGSTASTHSSAHPRTMALDHDVVELGDGNASGAIETPKKILRDAFVTPSKPPAPLAARPAELESEPESCFRAPAPRLPTSPVHVISNPVFRSHGTLPTGFPEARDLSKDVQAGKIPVRGQSRFSRVDVLTPAPLAYHDTTPLPPPCLLASLSPVPQILLYGDGLPYKGFLRSFSIADLASMEWTKFIGLTTFVMLPSFAPFEDEPPFFSHKTIVRRVVSLLRQAKKQNKTTNVWLAYVTRSNVADSSFATLLDRRIDLIPALSFLYLTVVCPIIHLASRDSTTNTIVENVSPLDQPLILMHLTSIQLPKKHHAKTVEFFPRLTPTETADKVYEPHPSLFQLRIDVPNKVVLDVEGTEVVWDITGTLPLMLMLNGLGPDDTSTVLRDIVVPRITKDHWPIPVNSSPDTHKIFDFHVPLDVLSRFYEEQDALGEMRVSMGLLHESVKDNALVITHQPRSQKGGPKKKKMPSPEIRDAIEMNSSLRKKFAFIVLLNKYDIFAMVHERMLIQPAVQEIENLGDMIVICATKQQRLMAKEVSRTVTPPYTLVRFPPSYANPEIMRSAATFGPVQRHQIFQQSGILLIRYQSDVSARASYGVTLPGPVYFTSGNPENDTTEGLTQRLSAISLSGLPLPVLNEHNLAAVAGSTVPPFNVPDIRTRGSASPVPSAIPEASAPVSPTSDARHSDCSFPQPALTP